MARKSRSGHDATMTVAGIRLSSLALVAANLVPLLGIAFFGWRVLDVLMLYWIENVVIGVINVLRMLISSGQRKAFLAPFFTLHYGIFCYGHLMAITALFGDALGDTTVWGYLFDGSAGEMSRPPWRSPMWLAVAAIAASHLFSLFSNFIAGGEYRRTSADDLMHRPYGRIIVLHVAVIAGAALIEGLGSPVSLIVVLVVGKITLDLRYHAAERERFSASSAGTAS